MKKSELKQIIKEEIKKVLIESSILPYEDIRILEIFADAKDWLNGEGGKIGRLSPEEFKILNSLVERGFIETKPSGHIMFYRLTPTGNNMFL